MQRAAQWLYSKEVRIRGDWTKQNPYPEASGWAFEYNNEYYPDTDDTAMVLMALRLMQVPAVEQEQANAAFQRALRLAVEFPGRDGGWGAFDRDITKRWLEDVPFADHNAILSDVQRSDRANSRAFGTSIGPRMID